MKVFVVGGTGAIGGHAVPALVRAGHMVTGLARTPEKATQLSKQGASPITVSMFDRAALTEAFKGHDAVINLATAIPPTAKFMQTKAWADNDRVRTEGSAAIVDAAIAAGVPRVVQESVSMIYRDGGDAWINEGCPTDNFPMARANHAAEASANRFSSAGGVGVVLRFGWFYGPGARHSEQFFALARRHICIMIGPPDGYVSSIHVSDGGAAVVAALMVAAGTYNIVDDESLTKRAYADALAAAAGKSAWLRAPGRLALLLGDRSTSLTRSLRVSNARFRAASEWLPTYPSARRLAGNRHCPGTTPSIRVSRHAGRRWVGYAPLKLRRRAMIPILIAALVVFGLPTLYFAIRSREFRKFLTGAFFVSGGMQFYFYLTNLTVPLVGTSIVQTPELSGVRSIIHFMFFLICFYFGFIKRPKVLSK